MIEGLVIYFKVIGWHALIQKMYKYKRMTRDEEDDDVLDLKNDEHSVEFRVLGWKDFHNTSIEISLSNTIYLHFICNLNFSNS